MTIVARIRELLMEGQLAHAQIVEAVRGQFPEARTSTKSVASIATDMRRSGRDVPYRARRVQVQMELGL